MSDTDAGLGKVVVNRSMSLDGFIAGRDNAMDWVIEYMREDPFPEVMTATGAMLIGRRTHEVAKRMSEEDTDYDGGPVFVLTHQDRKSTRLNSSHANISYAVFCLHKQKLLVQNCAYV